MPTPLAKTTKILIIGFGSIGQRHYYNLLDLGYTNLSVYDTDSSKLSDVATIDNLDNDTLSEFEVAFVCTPNHLHVEIALKCAQAGCHLFIEKPLSHTLDGLSDLKELCQNKNLITMVGCNLRYHPCYKYIHDAISDGKLGKIRTIDMQFGHYLPSWRPNSDYRTNYAASKEQGGGIVLDDIHQFDMLFWYNDFAAIKDAKMITTKISDLEIDTPDVCRASYLFENNVVGTVSCDYLQPKYSHSCKVVTEEAALTWDWDENIVWQSDNNNKENVFSATDFELNQMYLDQMEYFLDCVAQNKETENNLERAITSLTNVLAYV